MIKKITREELEKRSGQRGVNVTRRAPRKPASERSAKTSSDPDIKGLLRDMASLLKAHNLTLEQLTQILGAQHKPSQPMTYLVSNIKELHITERDANGDILRIEPVMETKH